MGSSSRDNTARSNSLRRSFAIEDIGLQEFRGEEIERLLARSGGGMTLLLVEDCPDTGLLLGHILENAGFDVTIIEDAYECIDKAMRGNAAGLPFDIILIDIGLPLLDGMGVAKILREKGYDGLLVAMTSFPTRFDSKDCASAGFDYFLPKKEIRDRFLSVIEARSKSDKTDPSQK